MHVSIQNRQKRFTNNINKVLDSALPSDFIDGAKWYREARLWAYGVSKANGVSLRKVCAMLAALSPRSKWDRNKADTENLIIALTNNSALPKCATYGAMVRKAINIFNAKTDSVDSMTSLLNGPKITAFFLNIYDCNSQRVTVDTWIQLVSLGEYLAVEDRPSLTKKDYQLIESIIVETAKTKNIAPPVLQAVLWVAFKRKTESKEFN